MQAYQPCHEPFVRYCSALAHGKMDAQDLVQDVLLSAFQRFEAIRKKHELLHYLIRAAKNRAASAWRTNRRSTDLCEKQAARLQSLGASAEMLLDVEILYATLERLPPDQRDALVLFEVSGLPMAEIAAIQGVNENAMKTRVSRARAAVREMLGCRTQQHPNAALGAFKTLML